MREIPGHDIKSAAERSLLFRIATKGGRGKPWEFVEELIDSIEIAMARARSVDAYEVAVFVATAYSYGVMYWSSRDPDLFNSVALEREVNVKNAAN